MDGEHFASAQWKEMLGQPAQEIIDQFTGGKYWGGAVVTENEVQGVIHQAALKEFVEGEKKKTKRAIAILKQCHYHLAIINNDDQKQVFFETDSEYNKALELTIEKLKTSKEAPPTKLRATADILGSSRCWSHSGSATHCWCPSYPKKAHCRH